MEFSFHNKTAEIPVSSGVWRQGIYQPQIDWCSTVFTCLLSLFTCFNEASKPSVEGRVLWRLWKSLMWFNRKKLANSLEVNWGPLSDTICSGIACNPTSVLVTPIVISAVVDFISTTSSVHLWAQKTFNLSMVPQNRCVNIARDRRAIPMGDGVELQMHF